MHVWGHCSERSIGALMLSQQAEILRHCINEMCLESVERRSDFICPFRNNVITDLALDRCQSRAAGLDNPGLFPCNLAKV